MLLLLTNVFITIFKCNMRQRYEGVEPYINDLQSKCIAVCYISLFLVKYKKNISVKKYKC